MDQAEAEQRVGQTLCGKWKLERLLGVGGMAAVYASVHKIGRHDAIKILHLDVSKNAELRARFEQEAHVANRFKHPGAVEIRDVDITEDGCPLLVMELLDGQTLSDKARRSTIELSALLRYVDELLDVLAAAHKEGIVHRDIKLDNLFITADDRLKVLDFGIARVRDGSVSSKKTAFGATLGTAPYMPPEQVQGREIDGRADVFAVGATMFRILARRRIHEAATEPELLSKMATQPAPPLASVAPKVPADICLVVDRALRFRKDDRYPDAGTMQADVRAVRAGLTPPYAAARALTDQPESADASLLPTPLLGATARAAGGMAKPQAHATLAASPSSIRGNATVAAAPMSRAFAPVSGATASAAGTEATFEAPPSSFVPSIDTSRAAGSLLLGGGTLKSANVVPLPPVSSRGPEIEVVSMRRPERSSAMKLVMFGGAFVALGALVGGVVYAVMNTGAGGTSNRTEQGEPKHQQQAPHLTTAHPPLKGRR